jgi:hypothetical protein
MTAQDYILSELQKLAEPMPIDDIGSTPIEEAIFAKVMSKKFRKLKADDTAISITKGAIKYAVAHSKPVKVGLLFGGNKLWRFEEAPQIDWAEFFSLIYYLRWMKSIARVYAPGAHFDYYSQDVSVESLNNVPRSETDQYSETFKLMLEWIRPYMPEKVQVTYRRHADEYTDVSEYYAELEEAKKVVLAKNNGKLPELDDAQKAATELNVKLLPGQDDDPLWREKVELQHQAIFETESLLPYLTDPAIIPTCPTLYPELIATGSTKKSYAKFWAAVGVLEKSDAGFNELVLTPNQLASANFEWQDVNLEGLAGKNFKRIRVLR